MTETTIVFSGTLTTTQCWCGIHLAVPDPLLSSAHNDGRTIYCPLGHEMTWTETEADRQRKARKQAEQAVEALRERLGAERDLRQDTERRLSAQKGATTRAKKRHAAALCPCCNRSFVQLRRHMEAKHPGYDPAKP